MAFNGLREKTRDARDFDLTSLREGTHGAQLTRDYTAHFFRWSFARRFAGSGADVLDIGCGVECPFGRLLVWGFRGAKEVINKYVGVDLGPIRLGNFKRAHLHPNFDFTTRYDEILSEHGQFSVITCFEVIEHMLPEHGEKMLAGARACLRPDGLFLISTPCYDGTRHAANHIHEFTVDELRAALDKAGFEVVKRFGTFMDIKHITKEQPDGCDIGAVHEVWTALKSYYDNNALSCFFAPLFPDYSRNNLWVCKLK